MTALDSVIRSNAFRSRPRLRMSSLPSAMRGTQAKWIYNRLRLFNDYRSKPPKRSRLSGPNAGSLTMLARRNGEEVEFAALARQAAQVLHCHATAITCNRR